MRRGVLERFGGGHGSAPRAQWLLGGNHHLIIIWRGSYVREGGETPLGSQLAALA